MPFSWDDLATASFFINSGSPGENKAYLYRETGKIYWHSDFVGVDEEDELPDDIEDGTKYIALPDKRDLDIGKPLVMDFIYECLPDDADEVRRIFSRKGAYGHFKDFLERRGALERWYEFESNAEEKALRQWCADNGIEIGE